MALSLADFTLHNVYYHYLDKCVYTYTADFQPHIIPTKKVTHW